MPSANRFIYIATRGSALALAQSNMVLAQCRAAFPKLKFGLKIIKTTGDKLANVSLSNEGINLPKGLFTKELEVALLNHRADLAVHSLKDLPTELPPGLILGAIGRRADVRDVLIYRAVKSKIAASPKSSPGRGFKPKLAIKGLPRNAIVGTGSTRRKAQLLAQRPDLKVVEHRGNVPTRILKLAEIAELDAIVLAAAGLKRLNFKITRGGKLVGEGLPEGLLATILEPEIMLPCVGQGALGIETRANDERIAAICARLNHPATEHCVSAERAFLAGMGGGCQSPVAAYAEIIGQKIRLRAVSFREIKVRRAQAERPLKEAAALGKQLAAKLK